MEQEIHSLKKRLVISFSFLVPLMYISLGHMAKLPLPGFLNGVENALSFALTQFLLTIPVVVVNRQFFSDGFTVFFRGVPDMDSLVALGAFASLGYGIFALYRISWGLGHQQLDVVENYRYTLYFESAATLLTLFTLGKTLEAISQGRIGANTVPAAKLADKISGLFVPCAILIATVTFAVWMLAGEGFDFALARAVTVLVISCSCAVGLATPLAIMAGTGRGAKDGILYKNAEALETLCRVDTVVLGKTGTVTEGKPRVTDITAFGTGETALLTLAAALEQESSHPLAQAIVGEAKEQGVRPIPLEDSSLLSGPAVWGNTARGECLAGDARLMLEQDIDLAPARDLPAQYARDGKTPLYFAFGGQLVGIIALADLPKPDSAPAIKALQQRDLRVIMLTSDNVATAESVRRMTGVDEVIAEVLPQDKGNVIKTLLDGGHAVAMIGDGAGDAPALAQADIGISVGAGTTDAAIESADVILAKSGLTDAVTAIDLSRAVSNNIKQNLFWAFIFNVLGIPVAVGIFYPAFGLTLNPLFGAAVMSLSSICVVANALRLQLFKPKELPSAPVPLPASKPEEEEEWEDDEAIELNDRPSFTRPNRIKK